MLPSSGLSLALASFIDVAIRYLYPPDSFRRKKKEQCVAQQHKYRNNETSVKRGGVRNSRIKLAKKVCTPSGTLSTEWKSETVTDQPVGAREVYGSKKEKERLMVSFSNGKTVGCDFGRA